jgi:single-stranded-DNA-specific exonuclease
MAANILGRDQLEADAGPFLAIERSLTGRWWRDRAGGSRRRAAQTIAQRFDLTDVLARILAGRGVEAEDCEAFLAPSLRDLMPDPFTLTDMEAAAARIADAVSGGEVVSIFGDYDVDGATSAALLARFLRAVGAEAEIYIPDRIFEGYGPNVQAFDGFKEKGASLVVCVDCGTASHETLAHGAAIGLDVVVLDHHQTGDELPQASALVNPNRQDDLSGLGHLAAVGVTFLTVVAINRELRARGWYGGSGESREEPDLLRWLDIVALGTVCDAVPLIGLNRAFVAKGLIAMRARANVGLRALGEAARLTAAPDCYHLGFLLGPRINAGGRIGRADLGATLLSTEDDLEAAKIAATLDRLNAERQEIERRVLEVALAEAEAALGAGRGEPFAMVAGEGWHPGVVGLVATRIKDRFRLPAIAVAFDDKGIGTGSGRSVPGIDLGGAVRAAVGEGLLVKGGGHTMAAGLTVERGKLGALRAFLHEALGAAAQDGAREANALDIDAAVTASGATKALVAEVARAAPFGTGNPEPCFALPSHRVVFADTVGQGHVRCTLAAGDGSRLDAIAFRCADTPLGARLLSRDTAPLHLAGHLRLDTWGGREKIKLQIVDAAEVKPPR